MKKFAIGFWIVALLGLLFLLLRTCDNVEPIDTIRIKKSTWDSIMAIANTPPKIKVDTVLIKGETVYINTVLPIPVTKDSITYCYQDSIVNDSISVFVKDSIKGKLTWREWRYNPMVKKIYKETTVIAPKIVMVDVPIEIPKNGFYIYALTGGNPNAFLYGGGIDWITKKDRQIGYMYQKFGNVGFHSVKIGLRMKIPGN